MGRAGAGARTRGGGGGRAGVDGEGRRGLGQAEGPRDGQAVGARHRHGRRRGAGRVHDRPGAERDLRRAAAGDGGARGQGVGADDGARTGVDHVDGVDGVGDLDAVEGGPAAVVQGDVVPRGVGVAGGQGRGGGESDGRRVDDVALGAQGPDAVDPPGRAEIGQSRGVEGEDAVGELHRHDDVGLPAARVQQAQADLVLARDAPVAVECPAAAAEHAVGQGEDRVLRRLGELDVEGQGGRRGEVAGPGHPVADLVLALVRIHALGEVPQGHVVVRAPVGEDGVDGLHLALGAGGPDPDLNGQHRVGVAVVGVQGLAGPVLPAVEGEPGAVGPAGGVEGLPRVVPHAHGARLDGRDEAGIPLGGLGGDLAGRGRRRHGARAHDRRPAGQHDPGDRHQGLEPPDQGGPSTVRGAGGGAVHQDISYRGQSYRRPQGSPRRPAAIDGEGQDRWDPEILLLSPPMV